MRLEGADDLGDFDGRDRENLGLDAAVARHAGAYFSRCALQVTQILFSMLCSAVYKDATNNQNTINWSHYR